MTLSIEINTANVLAAFFVGYLLCYFYNFLSTSFRMMKYYFYSFLDFASTFNRTTKMTEGYILTRGYIDHENLNEQRIMNNYFSRMVNSNENANMTLGNIGFEMQKQTALKNEKMLREKNKEMISPARPQLNFEDECECCNNCEYDSESHDGLFDEPYSRFDQKSKKINVYRPIDVNSETTTEKNKENVGLSGDELMELVADFLEFFPTKQIKKQIKKNAKKENKKNAKKENKKKSKKEQEKNQDQVAGQEDKKEENQDQQEQEQEQQNEIKQEVKKEEKKEKVSQKKEHEKILEEEMVNFLSKMVGGMMMPRNTESKSESNSDSGSDSDSCSSEYEKMEN
jgi:hypothetical protein